MLLDDVQYRKNYFQNRNKIIINNEVEWITVPIKSHRLNTKINEILISDNSLLKWQEKMVDKIKLAYKKSNYYSNYSDELFNIICKKNKNLVDLNIFLIKWIIKKLGINTKMIKCSDLNIDGVSSDRILNICKHLNAQEYLSGISGKDYLDQQKFKENNITIQYQEFYHPIYKQYSNNFIPQISTIEALFMIGKQANQLFSSSWPEKIDKLFS